MREIKVTRDLKKHMTSFSTIMGNHSDDQDYEPLEVNFNNESGQIRIEFNQQRWRTLETTVEILKEIIAQISKPNIFL